MEMDALRAHGFPEAVVEAWIAREGRTLLPLQAAAVTRHDLFGGGNLLVQAPTSSGKTFIGEMAALHAALQGRKAVYLTPLKALAEEKYRDFQAKYADFGVDVIISTRDRREFDRAFEEGRFALAVVVYEKLTQLLVRRPGRLGEIAVVVADELELLSDPERGARVETLLTEILQSGARLIGLSAVVGQAERLASWMDASLVQGEARPVELCYGVLHDGVFRRRTHNGGTEGEERLTAGGGASAWEMTMDAVEAFTGRDESCLVFTRTRREARRGAEALAQRLSLPPAEAAQAALRALEPTHSRDALLQTLAAGVGFHNADLTPSERAAVEAAFRDGEARVLFATATLAQGLNLPAQNVFIPADKWRHDFRLGAPWKTPVTRAEFENMSGRAGRYGAGAPFGRAMVAAATPFEAEALWRRCATGPRDPVEPQLANGSLDDHVLRFVAARTRAPEADIAAFLERTLTGRWIWAETLAADGVAALAWEAAERLVEEALIAAEKGPAGRDTLLAAAPLGCAVASAGVSIETARALRHWLAQSAGREWAPLDLVLAAALTPCGRMLQTPLAMREYAEAGYARMLRERAAALPTAAAVPLNRLRRSAAAPTFEETRAIKTALFLMDWIAMRPMYDVETDYRVLSGQVLAAADQTGWLLDGAAALAEAEALDAAFVEAIRALAGRVRYGVPETALPLARLDPPGLTREAMAALCVEGLETPEALAQAPEGLIERWVPPGTAAALRAWAQEHTASAPEAASPLAERASAAAPILAMSDARPNEARLDGHAVPLQDKQYRLLRLLAAHPGECVAYETIYQTLWPESVVEPNQMHFHKRRLLNRMKAAAPARERLITAVPKRGYVLNLRPAEVRVEPVDGAASARDYAGVSSRGANCRNSHTPP